MMSPRCSWALVLVRLHMAEARKTFIDEDADELGFTTLETFNGGFAHSPQLETVYANVYHVGKLHPGVNKVLDKLYLDGAYHVGIQCTCFRKEAAYGGTLSKEPTVLNRPGAYWTTVRNDSSHQFFKTVELCNKSISGNQFIDVVQRLSMMEAWKCKYYDLLRHNCVSFANELSKQLCDGKELPPWTSSLAKKGAYLDDVYTQSVAPKLAKAQDAATKGLATAKELAANAKEKAAQWASSWGQPKSPAPQQPVPQWLQLQGREVWSLPQPQQHGWPQ
mmetsp:Transcript_16780/g.47916  ORF Transcript_16780/g.47916 Transcript_16780/m.47916 type:complete len:277 (+) Transcript_16780:93-923(+)